MPLSYLVINSKVYKISRQVAVLTFSNKLNLQIAKILQFFTSKSLIY